MAEITPVEVTHGDKGERMSMRAVIVAIILLVLLRDASADTVVIGTPGQIGAARFGANVGGALAAGVDYARLKAQLNAQIGAARRRFFAEYPKGRDFAQAEKEFAELLWSKDVYFMTWRLSTGSTPSMLGKLDAVTGGTVDNGIPSGAGFAFNRWVSGIRDSLGATAFPSESRFLAALEANKDAYAQYKEARDLAEFEMQCRARPGPYCALPGGYSHGGATERAARIADYYLAHYARTLSGGDAVKTKLRDAIIKYESLAYTTPDCIRHVGRIFENDPRHDTNLAALRHAIAKYESVKVMSPEDICIWAGQDMELAEHARNGTPQVPPRPKDFWDTLFRNSKFNELYPLTSDQEREMRERRQAALAGLSAPPSAPEPRAQLNEQQRLLHARRMASAAGAAARQDGQAWPVTIIDYYTGSPEARAANVSRYEVVRLEATRKTAGVQSAARAPADTAVPQKRDLGTAPPASTATPRATDSALYDQALSAHGKGDYVRARALFEQTCNAGNNWACSDLGYMFRSGKGGAVDMARAREFFDKACKGGNASACSMKDEPPPAVAKAPAVSDDPTRKIYDEAFMASRSRDYTRARTLFEEACKGGNAKACSELGFMFGTGMGGPLDQTQARMFYEHACTGGDARGCLNLGFLFSAGKGGPQDSARAQALYEQACTAGESSACSRLKTMQRRAKSRSRHSPERSLPAN